ncbi:uncharacterized protein LOC105169257 isoform X1 [Sesamum indicum]|uniref:Uncharacterized protein LOC105169257 isoform X1 n=1 Tax=Sesamum indicum TaxID=4182 RepID=A0A6I9U271_SESIN|nr:uncharacterized protein LOC105169257 isoform X1 [Sesamum indicum]
MAARNPSSWYKFQTLVKLLYRYRGMSGSSWRCRQFHHRDLPPYKPGGEGSADQGLRFISADSRAYSQPQLGMEKDESSSDQPPLPAPPKFGFSNWVKWLLGSVVSLLMPFWKNKWDYLLTLEGEAAEVAEEVEAVAQVVEKVATTADKALTEVANQLPDKSKLKEAAQVMEHVSNVASHDAQLIENIIEKVGDVKQDLEELERMVEPIVDKIVQGKHPKT